MDPQTAAKLVALLTALAAITLEDIQTIKNAGTLGPDVVANIESLQQQTMAIDQDTINTWNAAT